MLRPEGPQRGPSDEERLLSGNLRDTFELGGIAGKGCVVHGGLTVDLTYSIVGPRRKTGKGRETMVQGGYSRSLGSHHASCSTSCCANLMTHSFRRKLAASGAIACCKNCLFHRQGPSFHETTISRCGKQPRIRLRPRGEVSQYRQKGCQECSRKRDHIVVMRCKVKNSESRRGDLLLTRNQYPLSIPGSQSRSIKRIADSKPGAQGRLKIFFHHLLSF